MARARKKIVSSKRSPAAREISEPSGFFQRIQSDIENRQSVISLVLGVLILLVVGVLLFNYFSKPSGEIGPSQQTSELSKIEDVKKTDLPGKYTVKEGDTLFLIAQSYYDDGFQYSKLAEANKLENPDVIEAGQVLDIPKLEQAEQPKSPIPASAATLNADKDQTKKMVTDEGSGGAINQTIWGEAITTDSYTVVAGDWLSKIAGRAYGDIYSFDKIAKANNIADPDVIEPGTKLKIPR